MAASEIRGVRISGLAAAVPARRRGPEELAKLWGEAEASKIVANSGVQVRRLASADMCTSDLCHAAAEALFKEGACAREDIDVLIFVSQTPDFFLPATACVLHGRLGLPKTCAALDVNLGCSGYVYGLWLASSLLAAGGGRKAILLAGDTISRVVNPGDRSTLPLFGDAGTATLIERSQESKSGWNFVMGSDGKGAANLQVRGGAFRAPRSASSGPEGTVSEDAMASPWLQMNGSEVFTFTLRELPPMIEQVLKNTGWTVDSIDAVVFHQANLFMLEYLRKKLRIAQDRFILGLREYGNTSSASIPLAMVTELRPRLTAASMKLLFAGFGVGFSWGAVTMESGPMIIPEVVELGAP